jgi:hypothetical protein
MVVIPRVCYQYQFLVIVQFFQQFTVLKAIICWQEDIVGIKPGHQPVLMIEKTIKTHQGQTTNASNQRGHQTPRTTDAVNPIIVILYALRGRSAGESAKIAMKNCYNQETTIYKLIIQRHIPHIDVLNLARHPPCPDTDCS